MVTSHETRVPNQPHTRFVSCPYASAPVEPVAGENLLGRARGERFRVKPSGTEGVKGASWIRNRGTGRCNDAATRLAVSETNPNDLPHAGFNGSLRSSLRDTGRTGHTSDSRSSSANRGRVVESKELTLELADRKASWSEARNDNQTCVISTRGVRSCLRLQASMSPRTWHWRGEPTMW